MKRQEEGAASREAPAVRVDVYLDVACLFPTRSQAAAACSGGKVDLNGTAARAHKLVRAGDRLAVTLPTGRRTFVVKAVAEHHLPKARARELYEETTPPPTPEELERRWLDRQLAPRRDPGAGRLSHRERRDRERLRGT